MSAAARGPHEGQSEVGAGAGRTKSGAATGSDIQVMMKRFRRASGSLVAAACVAVRVEPGASVGSVVSGLGRLGRLLALCVS